MTRWPRLAVRSPAALAIDPETAATPLAAFLARRSLDEAASALDALPVKLSIPLPWLRRAVFALVGVALVSGIFRMAAPAAFTTALNRIVHPTADIPPWSKFQFIISPEIPAVIYGSDLLVTCDLQGDQIDEPWNACCANPALTRYFACRFPANPRRDFPQVGCCDAGARFAFACGKARSKWLPVEVLLQPNFLAGALQVTPPAYMDLPPSRGPLDSLEIPRRRALKWCLNSLPTAAWIRHTDIHPGAQWHGGTCSRGNAW